MASTQYPPFPAYKGDENYIFISYAHRDSATVFPELVRMRSWGFNVWYDEGIDPGNEWPDEIAIALKKASFFVFFVSPRAVGSVNCRNEVYFALDQKKPFLCVYLMETNIADINAGLALSIGSLQAVLKHQMDDASYEQKLHRALSKEFPKDSIPGALPTKHAAVPAKPSGNTATFLIIGLLTAVIVILGGLCAVLLLKPAQSSVVTLATPAPEEVPTVAPPQEPTSAPLSLPTPPPTLAPTTEANSEPNFPPIFPSPPPPPPPIPVPPSQGVLNSLFMCKGPFQYTVEAASAQDFPALKDPVYVVFTFKHAGVAAGRGMMNLQPGEGSWFDHVVLASEPSECRLIVDRAETESFNAITNRFMTGIEGGFGLPMTNAGSYLINTSPYHARSRPKIPDGPRDDERLRIFR